MFKLFFIRRIFKKRNFILLLIVIILWFSCCDKKEIQFSHDKLHSDLKENNENPDQIIKEKKLEIQIDSKKIEVESMTGTTIKSWIFKKVTGDQNLIKCQETPKMLMGNLKIQRFVPKNFGSFFCNMTSDNFNFLKNLELGTIDLQHSQIGLNLLKNNYLTKLLRWLMETRKLYCSS